MEIDDHLFRRESGRMVAALTRIFGVHNLALAEDVVQDAFCRALEVWKFRGAPENPSAWLMATAKNRALDVLRRERTARTFAPDLGRLVESEWTLAATVEEMFEPGAIRDEELRMMFSCCPPRLTESGQIALILQLVCGFGIAEIAGAFLLPAETIKKRLQRSRKVLAASKNLFDIGDARRFSARLAAVQRALYLLFNEGYHGASAQSAVRADLCRDAMRLVTMLLEHSPSQVPSTYALAALMSFHAARLPGRVDESGRLTLLVDQDRSRWDRALIAQGKRLLDLSATGQDVSEYHVEAAIAFKHVDAPSFEATEWDAIVELYDRLLAIRPTPVAALSRAIAIAQAEGPERALDEIARTVDATQLAGFPFYPATLGDLELRRGDRATAAAHFRTALEGARNQMERDFFVQRVSECE